MTLHDRAILDDESIHNWTLDSNYGLGSKSQVLGKDMDDGGSSRILEFREIFQF